MQVLKTRTSIATVGIDADGILHIVYDAGAEETLADAQAIFEAGRALRAQRRGPVLVDLRPLRAQQRDARQFWSSPEVAADAPAVALLVSSRVSMLIANVLTSLTNRRVPTRIFTDEINAVIWLLGCASPLDA